MIVRRILVSLAVLGAWLVTLQPAAAHRVDEYLQATRLSIDIQRVDLEIDLTAGVAVASEVFAWIDTNRDGEISNAEGEAYARRMLGSVVLKVDGRPVPVTLVEISFPQFRDMRLGVGTIRLRATAKVAAATAGRHQVSFLNTHRTESSVYLVNALVPVNPRIQLAEQRRDRAQLGLTLDYTVMAEASSDRTLLLLTGLAMATCLALRHGYSLTRDRRAPRASYQFFVRHWSRSRSWFGCYFVISVAPRLVSVPAHAQSAVCAFTKRFRPVPDQFLNTSTTRE